MRTLPATGSTACFIATIEASTGWAITTRASLARSEAVLTDAGSSPLLSTYLVWLMPRPRARLFIKATKFDWEPASQSARTTARLSPEGSSNPSSSCSSERRSPATTGTTESSWANSCWYKETSAAAIVTMGPLAPSASGCELSTTSAVISLVVLAIATGTCPAV